MIQAFAIVAAAAVGGLYYAFGRTNGASVVKAFVVSVWFAIGTAVVIVLF